MAPARSNAQHGYIDPLIRLHRADENESSQFSALLAFLRQIKRQFQTAVLLVHRARKDFHSGASNKAVNSNACISRRLISRSLPVEACLGGNSRRNAEQRVTEVDRSVTTVLLSDD